MTAKLKETLVQRLEDYQREKNQVIGVFVDASPEKKKGTKKKKGSREKENDDEPLPWISSKAKAALLKLHLDDNNPSTRRFRPYILVIIYR